MSKVSTISLESATVEPLLVTLASTYDPTGLAVEFMLTAESVTTPTGAWSPGTWQTAWNSVRLDVVALTPTLGNALSGAVLGLTEGTAQRLWMRLNGAIRLAARVVVT